MPSAEDDYPFSRSHFNADAFTSKPFGWRQPSGHRGSFGPEGRYKILGLEQLLDQPDETSWLIKNVLTSIGVSIVFGPSQAGKTFVAHDIAAHVLLGRPWSGHRTRAGRVLVIALEGHSGLRRRIQALRDRHQLKADAPLGVLMTTLDLRSPSKEFLKSVREFRPDLIIVDTLSRAMGDGDENLARDAAALIAAAEMISLECDAHVMLIHHTGHENKSRERGNSALRANVETSIAVFRGGQKGEIILKKVRDAEAGKKIPFRLVPVELGLDEDGDPISSCIVEYLGDSTRAGEGDHAQQDEAVGPDPEPTSAQADFTGTRPLPENPKRALELLCELIREKGDLPPAEYLSVTSGASWVSVEEWREYCAENGFAGGLNGQDRRQKHRFKQAHKRARDCLIERGFVAEGTDPVTAKAMVWPVSSVSDAE